MEIEGENNNETEVQTSNLSLDDRINSKVKSISQVIL